MHHLDNVDSPELLAADTEDDSHLPKPVVAPIAKSKLRVKQARMARASHSDGEDENSSLLSSRSAVSSLSRLSNDQLKKRLDKTKKRNDIAVAERTAQELRE